MAEYSGWDTMAVLNQRQEQIERDRQRRLADKALRDTFAAAALTGLISRPAWFPDECAPEAYRVADAMLRERANTNHDAAPAARASDGRERTDKSPDRPVDGTGDAHARFCSAVMNWISEATVALPAEHPNSRRIMAEACAECWDAFDRLAHQTIHKKDGKSDRPKPIESTPGAHATPGEGTERRECTEPVAWAVVRPDDEVTVVAFRRSDARDLATGSDRIVPLYRQPQPTLTDAEREAISCAAVAYAARSDRSVSAATLRGLLERTNGGGE